MNKLKTHLVTAAVCIASTFLFLPSTSVFAAASTSFNNGLNFRTFEDALYPKILNQNILNHWVCMPIKENVSKDKAWNIN